MMQIIIAWIATAMFLILSTLFAFASVQLLMEKDGVGSALVGFCFVSLFLALAYGGAWIGGI